ncbi:MAG: hypothetical protein K8F91_23315 [Candidatus Obscuribacterales bacterium]|nr:hypothetical protein [Candidatus Obscuribacterales bacterium]
MFVAPQDSKDDFNGFYDEDTIDKKWRESVLYRNGRKKIGKGLTTFLKIASVMLIGFSMLALLCHMSSSKTAEPEPVKANYTYGTYEKPYRSLPFTQYQIKYSNQYRPQNTYGGSYVRAAVPQATTMQAVPMPQIYYAAR